MKKLSLISVLISLALAGCGGEEASPVTQESHDSHAETPAVAEQTHHLRGVIVDRDPVANTLKVDHEAIGDWMGAMTMSFPVRGADVGALPDNGQTVTGTIHVAGTEFWLSDVVAAPASTETSTSTPEAAPEQVE